MTSVDFTALALDEPILRALGAQSYSHPTPIQRQAIPPVLEGRDLLGVAQTGTGKTAAFALPILQRLSHSRHRPQPRHPRVLVLAPTRELAIQIADGFRTYGQFLKLRHAVIFGGVGQRPQVDALARGVDVLVATPGRLLDLMTQGFVRLDAVETLVLDEADRMLDMGFIRDIRKILAVLPRQRQSLLFSATMPPEVERLAGGILHQPVKVSVSPAQPTVERIEQRVYFVAAAEKRRLLTRVLDDPALSRVIVFARTKHGANRIAQQLGRENIAAAAIHGNKSQGARQQALEGFRAGRVRVLVATDIAARGIDVDGITHVINYELPNVPESYVHRIGRTARAGAAGIALSFCAPDERAYLRDIERLSRCRLTPANEEPAARSGEGPAEVPARRPDQGPAKPGGGRRRGRRTRGRGMKRAA